MTSTFLQVGIVPGKTACERRLGYLWSPQRQQSVALGIGILQSCAFPFVSRASQSYCRHVTIHVDNVEVRNRGVADCFSLLCLEFFDVAALCERVDAENLEIEKRDLMSDGIYENIR